MTTKTVGHTPGPWRVYATADLPPSYEDHGWRILARLWGGKYIVVVPKAQIPSLNRDGEANARLIAAAPELLKALENLVLRLSGDVDTPNGWSDIVRLLEPARAAIAKAEGDA